MKYDSLIYTVHHKAARSGIVLRRSFTLSRHARIENPGV